MDTCNLEPDQLEKYVCRTLEIVDYTLDDAELERRCPLDHGRHIVQPRESLGQLDTLPYELVADILLALDLPSLVTFRRVNCRAIGLIDSLHEYRMISENCINVLRAAVSLDATSFSCWDLYQTLSTSNCDTCSWFGGYLYLITGKRVCWSCFTRQQRYFPLLAGEITRYTGLSGGALVSLPHITSLPGCYTPFLDVSKERILLYDQRAVFDASPKLPSHEFYSEIQGRDLLAMEPRRYMAIISAPYFRPSDLTVDWGYYCAGCKGHEEFPQHFRDKYTEDGIINHIKRRGMSPGAQDNDEGPCFVQHHQGGVTCSHQSKVREITQSRPE
ncbi:uncharacterized protein F4822DRAFT_392679 [Hypoxylon trugodes]|uniref:uncharacterized protein n=1 Tax=Hypoxylon trugodes TaxID=326681 RepID=UPI0021910247|nr:uncharacterized protein F4822DRAFT_392679 [Hypoxylon trugodes]KAI1392960.1 hypothetical protein F4822DRAFT_392679 [Hypoxylon trugodes]